jgi:polar amino acid transport system substrate-binding protein
MKNTGLASVAMIAYLLLPQLGHAEDAVNVSYNERPPYLVPAADGSATGLTGTPAANAFKAAGIAVTWAKVPTTRQMALVKEAGMNCAIGWFKNPEREQFAKFTKAIYRDKPWIVLANKGFAVQDGAKLQDVLSAKGVRVLTKEAFSYGPYIDGVLAKTKPAITVSNGTTTQMLQLINANMVDFMFVSEEEAEYLVEQAGLKMTNFRQLRFPDMPAGDKRYIMCSKHVPDDVISRLNKAITFE